MNRKHFLIAITIASMACLNGCKSEKKATAMADTDQEVIVDSVVSTELKTDSVVFKKKAKGAECKVVVDFPQGTTELDRNIKAFICDLLGKSGPFGLMQDEKSNVTYTGDKNNGKAVVNFFGEIYAATMKQSWTEIQELNENSDEPMPYSYEIEIRLEEQTDQYVTLSINTYSYTGGAHGSSMNYSINFAKTYNDQVAYTINQKMTQSIQPLLRKGVIEYFKEQGETISDADLNKVLFIDNNTIPLPAMSPVLTTKGLRFEYQQYEIGPYAIGLVNFTLPYKDVKGYMTQEATELIGNY